jgi:hypothetical protein
LNCVKDLEGKFVKQKGKFTEPEIRDCFEFSKISKNQKDYPCPEGCFLIFRPPFKVGVNQKIKEIRLNKFQNSL